MAPAKNNLVALGTAAVIAVYSTGYARTRAAAAEFADEGRERPPVHPAKQDAVVPIVASPAPETPRSAPAAPPAKSTAVTAETAKPSASKKVAAKEPKADTTAKAASAAPPAATTAVAPPPLVASTLPAPPTTPPKDTTAKATADTATQSEKPAGYKDGMFTGWGTSRHGDIQATVMIKDGKIVGAVISECLTQYSCSWISMLPQQVIDRQSAEVDFVSGATQSTNAFYYAVLNALKKAK